ncbi:MAG: RES family NAD+ phosphorylase, partial [Nitrososphaera sp.]
AGKVSIDWGTKWCAGMTSALALVPSVVVPEEFNVLVNPRHADAAKLRATKIRKWMYDPRALGR